MIEADLLRQAGDFHATVRILENGDDFSTSIAGRVFASRTLGEALGSLGRISDAIACLEKAIMDGEPSGEHDQVAQAALSRFTLVTNHRDITQSQKALGDAKRAVLRCGDVQTMAALHARVGQAHAQRSLATLAVSELQSALRLLESEPNEGIDAFVKLALSGAEFALARYGEAAKWARLSRDAAAAAGHMQLYAAAQANLAFLECRRGHFKIAGALAESTLGHVGQSLLARGALLDTLATICIHQGQLDRASDHLGAIDHIVHSNGGVSFLLVDVASTKDAFLRATKRHSEAEEALVKGMEVAQVRGDMMGWSRLALLRAEVQCSLGDLTGARRSVADALEQVPQPSLEVVGLLARARAVIAVRAGNLRRAREEFRRATRIFGRCGDIVHRRDTQTLRRQGRDSSNDIEKASANPRCTQAQNDLAKNLSYMCVLTPHPDLAGHEAVLLLKRLRITDDAQVVRFVDEAVSDARPQLAFLGRVGSEAFFLDAGVPPDPDARVSLVHVLRTIELARTAFQASADAARRVLSWDLDVAPEGKKGLYISTSMKRLLGLVRQVAPTDLPVLIMGETGTGKEVLAAEVHALSRRAQDRFVAFNVTAIPRDMLEGQLFGYRRGAFTGATSDVKGLIREAEGGTLFLDEIGELGLDLQPKLLRFLESSEIQPLGERPLRVNVRIIAATNAHLRQLVTEGRFREDLYFRLNVVPLEIPPLRERREEVPTLINYFLTQHARAAGKPLPQLSSHALERLVAFEWPGNVRQLTNELKRLVALQPENLPVEIEHLSDDLRRARAPIPKGPPTPGSTLSVRLDQPLPAIYDDVDRVAIPRALTLTRHNQSEAARRLGLTRKGLYLKRRRLGLEPPDSSE